MKYAVVEISGKQYKVSEGEEVVVDKLSDQAKEKDLPVYLFVNEKKVDIGKPVLKNVKVSYEVVKDFKGKKLYVNKFRAKSRYRKKIGYRHSHSLIKIKKISSKK